MSTSTAEESYFQVIAPDTVYMPPNGARGNLKLLAEAFRKLYEAQGSFYVIVDFTGQTGGMSAEDRKEAPNVFKVEWLAGCVYINASMGMRIALKAVNLALFLVGKVDYPSAWVTSMDDALVAVEGFRKERARTAAT